MLKHKEGSSFILCNESFILVLEDKQQCGFSEGEYNAPLSLLISNLGSKATRATGYHLFNGGHSPFQPVRPLSMSSQESQKKFVDTTRESSFFARHPEYYKDDGDFTILVENTLFKVGHSPLAVTTGLMMIPRYTDFYCRVTLQHLPTCSRMQWHLVATPPTKALFCCMTLAKN